MAEIYRNHGIESYRKFMNSHQNGNLEAATKHLNVSISHFKLSYKVRPYREIKSFLEHS